MLFLLLATVVAAVPLANESYPLTTVPGTKPWNPKEPLQQRIAYVDSTSISVSWNTYGQLSDDEALVWWGQDPLYLDQKAIAQSTTFNTSRTWSHHAVLTGLKPKTVYHYRVANTNCFGCSTIPSYTFTTPRPAGDTQPYTVAVVADMGLMGPDGLTNVTGTGAAGALGSTEINTIQSMTQNLDAFDHIIHVGDLAYADYFLKESVGGFFGNASSQVIVNATSMVEGYEKLNEDRAYMVAVGNHESNCDNGGVSDKVNNINYTASICMPGQTNFTAYAEHWNMPSNGGSPSSQNFWYSYDNGMTHYVVYDSETDFGAGIYGPDEVGGTGKQMSPPRGYVNEQINWLKADLANVNRTKTPWVIAFGHRPFYNGIGDALCKPCQQAFEGIFKDNGVDLVMNGHNHVFSRSVPVWNNTADPNGYNNPKWPFYITNGLGGHYDGMDTNDSPLPKNIAAGIDHVYGWSLLTFANRTHMKHEFVASKNSTILDTVWLYKEH